jgi:hypothetical protein
MKNQEEFLDAEIQEFESPEYQDDFNQLSDARKNDILFKRLLFDYDDDLPELLKKFIRTNGNEPAWGELTMMFPELKYIIEVDTTPVNIAKIALKEITLY